jgi:hypothetical protein
MPAQALEEGSSIVHLAPGGIRIRLACDDRAGRSNAEPPVQGLSSVK